MPSPTTVLAIGRSALGLTNAIGTDQTLTADEAATVLEVFNDTLESWSIDDLAVYNSANTTYNTIANQGTYTIGSGGDFNGERPIFIGEPAYITYQTVSYQITEITQEQYNAIAIKTQPNILPQWFLYVNDFPLGRITLWPVPSQVLPVTFSIGAALTAATSVGQTVTYPKGYAEGFVYDLAVKLVDKPGKHMRDYPDILKLRDEIKGSIKRANNTPAILRFDPQLLGDNYYFNYGNGFGF